MYLILSSTVAGTEKRMLIGLSKQIRELYCETINRNFPIFFLPTFLKSYFKCSNILR